MTDEDTEQIHVKVPSETKEIAKQRLEHGGITRVVREALSRVAHGEEATERERTKDQLKEWRDEKREKVQERNQLDSDIEDLEIKIERAENRLEELEDKVGEYEGTLRVIEERMHEDRMHVDPGHGSVKEAATVGNCTPEDVIEDLQDRNPNLPLEQFEQKMGDVL